MILVGLGSNIAGPWGMPQETVLRALQELNVAPLHLEKSSKLIVTKPFGKTDQPDFVNAVAIISTKLKPEPLLQKLHAIEQAAGRQRRERWGPRSLDLDILVYQNLITDNVDSTLGSLQLPHPGIAERRFVLEPIAEIAPEWRHPETNLSAHDMLKKLR